MGPRVGQHNYQLRPARFSSISSTDGVRIQERIVPDFSMGGCRMSSEMCVPSGNTMELDTRSDQQTPVDVPAAVVQRVWDSTSGVPFKGVT
jgi:hypothetical protein